MRTTFIKKTLILVLVFTMAGFANAQTVKVAAAANLHYALEQIKKQYEKEYPNINLEITYGSSGTLTQQILNGAPYDFFMAADKSFPEKLAQKGATVGDVKTYAYGKLVMWSCETNLSKGISSVLLPEVKKIAIANPVTAPYGKAAVDLLKKQGLYDRIATKIVWGENISQAAQFAFSGNAEIGFIALSLALAPDMKGKGTFYVIPKSLMSAPIEQDCVLIKRKETNNEAVKFMKYVMSSKCNAIWKEYGYTKAIDN
jgi:molybdate transport system substrate-binding protein